MGVGCFPISMKILLAPLDPVHDAGLKLIKRKLEALGYPCVLLPPDITVEEIGETAIAARESAGTRKKEAIAEVAKEFGLPKRDVYNVVVSSAPKPGGRAQ